MSSKRVTVHVELLLLLPVLTTMACGDDNVADSGPTQYGGD